jgi:lipid II:glycine glycyltransferase (peptidoglycan interpeptide bridge formation enzyme)
MNIQILPFDPNVHSTIWNDIQLRSTRRSFLTASDRIEFQKNHGKEIKQFLIFDNQTPIGLIYLEIYRRKIAKYAYAPHGPVLLDEFLLSSEVYQKLSEFGKEFIRSENLNFFRIDPIIEEENQSMLKNSGWSNSMILGQARHQWLMNISDTEEEILKNLDKDTRYYVNRGQKKGVIVKIATDEKILEDFIDLMHQTKERQNFSNFDDDYYRDQWRNLRPVGMTEIFVAYFEDKPVAGALMNYYDKTSYYSHAGSTSDPELSKLASAYYLHWEMIKYAKQKGCTTYDFWGVIPKGIKHDWRGLSDFKMKFNGELRSLVGVHEVYNQNIPTLVQRAYDWWSYRKLKN